MKYKALMIDLDGTTIPNHPAAMPSKEVTKAILKAQKKLAVCIVTGRTFQETMPIINHLQITTPTVLMGGSQIIDGNSHEFIFTQPLKTHDGEEILKILRPYQVKIMLREKMQVIRYENKPLQEIPFAITVINISESLADEIAEKLSAIPTITTHKILSWTPGYFLLNIAHVQATKQHAIYEVAKHLYIKTHEMIGVGDGHNDFPLLMSCGLKVAVGNAVEDLKAIADYIAPPVEQDGLAEVIKRFVL